MTTVGFYNANAQRFFDDTIGVDMRPLYAPFLALVPPGGAILDAGCGSGRDSRYFKDHGYQVVAFDASEEMVRLSSAVLGQPVLHLTFQELEFEEEFDGIWASASLLHVPRAEMDDVLQRLTQALRPGGVLYASFKLGEGEVVRDGRLFNSYTEATFGEVLAHHSELELVFTRINDDFRPGRTGEQWLNLLLRRRSEQVSHQDE
jgi:SAM-dependent methyltransferase